MDMALIGNGAIAQYVGTGLRARGHRIVALVLRPGRVRQMPPPGAGEPVVVASVAGLPAGVSHVIDCAGHAALAEHGAAVLRAGLGLTTVSLGALADDDLAQALTRAARDGGGRLHLASGAIGALDCLRAARVGGLEAVRYRGRKPPLGWLGSPAEERMDLAAITGAPVTHFDGTAREAALAYPRNANVAAAVALAGLGFDRTRVSLVADPGVSANIHQIEAEGAFGRFTFHLEGTALPDNPRSSALAAMSVISKIEEQESAITF